jgi:hypothetical protein
MESAGTFFMSGFAAADELEPQSAGALYGAVPLKDKELQTEACIV